MERRVTEGWAAARCEVEAESKCGSTSHCRTESGGDRRRRGREKPRTTRRTTTTKRSIRMERVRTR